MPLAGEDLVPARTLADRLQRTPQGLRALWRRGYHGVRLETVLISNERYTSVAAVERFLAAVPRSYFDARRTGKPELLAELRQLGVTVAAGVAGRLSTRALKQIRWAVVTNGGETSHAARKAIEAVAAERTAGGAPAREGAGSKTATEG